MHLRIWVSVVVLFAAVLAALTLAALLAWPSPTLAPASSALARVELDGFAGSVVSLEVQGPGGQRIPVSLLAGALWPVGKLGVGERLTVTVSVRRPSWAAWLVGRTQTRRFTITTPSARLRASWLLLPAGARIAVKFEGSVSVVSLDGARARTLARPTAVIETGLRASGRRSAGSIEVAAVPRRWERLPAPVVLSWFPAAPEPEVLARPADGGTLAPSGTLTLVFSRPVADILGRGLPRLTPAIPGRWQRTNSHTLTFVPKGLGFALGTRVRVWLPRPLLLAGRGRSARARTLAWQVPVGTTLRLQQLLAELGYLPLLWSPYGAAPPHGARAELAAALSPPKGHFSWRYANTPSSLKALWSPGQPNTITMGAVMMFEHDNRLAVDGIAGAEVWRALLADIASQSHRRSGYDYVYVHSSVPESLNLWVDGSVVLTSPGNTGVPAAPTKLGTFVVFEHIPVGTMHGTNPDGIPYDDPGVRWISYFHGGEAIHAFPRASYGTPQSLGCVELPLAAAEQVWPYTPIGTLVTIES